MFVRRVYTVGMRQTRRRLTNTCLAHPNRLTSLLCMLSNEFHMTNDSYLFRRVPQPDCLPLFEGKMMHQFMSNLVEPRYWIDEKEGRQALLGRRADAGQTLDYQRYRIAFRRIGRNTDTRTMIATMLQLRWPSLAI